MQNVISSKPAHRAALFVALFVALLAAPLLVFAKPVAKVEGIGNGAILVMHDTPCANEKALAQVKEDYRGHFKHGEYTGSDGKSIVACWAVHGAAIYIVDEEGDQGRLPVEAAQPIGKKDQS